MSINRETLRSLRGSMPQQALAEKAKVDRRTISRIEAGTIAPDRVREETIKRLARALNTTPGVLAKAPDDEAQRDAMLREYGYRKIKTYLDARAAMSYALVEKRYGISARSQIEMAPLFTALLAEMSLAERKQRLDEANTAFEQSMVLLPRHLAHGAVARSDFGEAYSDEADSIADKDLFGKRILARAESRFIDSFDPDEGNPFFDFLQEKREALDKLVEEDMLMFERPDAQGLPNAPKVLDTFLDEVCAENFWARCALEEGHVRMSDIPADLWAKDKDTERGAWLEARYPAERRAEMEARRAEMEALAASIDLHLETSEASDA